MLERKSMKKKEGKKTFLFHSTHREKTKLFCVLCIPMFTVAETICASLLLKAI